MLSAFKAQSIHELKARDKSRIESLLAYGDRLLVGLSNGCLRVYRVNTEEPAAQAQAVEDGSGDKDVITDNDKHHAGALDGDNAGIGNGDGASETKSKAVELKREVENFSRRPVQQLAIIKEANLLVSLSDTYVSLHDLQTFTLVERLERTKGTVCFAVTSNVVKDADTNVPSLVSRLAVGAKRKVLCWTWLDMELMPDVAELNMEASVKSLNWADGTHLIAGMDPGFSVVDVATQEVTAITKPTPNTGAEINSGELAGVRFAAVSSSGMGYMGMGSWVPKPTATGLSGNQVLLAKDVNTLFTGVDGKPLEKRQVPWSLAPEAIGYSYPYLLALQPPEKGILQIRNPETLTLLQTIGVPGATILHVPQPNISLAHAGKGFLVASDRVIWRMNALPYNAQLAELAEKQRFDEAISLLELLEDTLIDDKAGRIREIMSQKAISLFQQQKYRPALDLFTDAKTSPERVIALYPKIIAGELSTIPEDNEVDHTSADGLDGKNEESSKDVHSTPSKSMFGILKGSHKKVDSDTASLKSPARADSDNMSIRPKAAKAADKPLEGDDLKLAVRCLCSFLAESRKEMKNHLNPDGSMKEDPPSFDSETGKPAFSNLLPDSMVCDRVGNRDWRSELLRTAQLIDTTLFRAYMLATPSLAGSLFRIDNFCDPEVVQSALYEGERYNDLIEFLHGKGLHRQALEMLAKFGKDEADGQVPDGMRGPERTVGYLKQLPPELVDVVLEFVRWPITEAPDVGIEVFLADTENAERLPRDQVLEFLSSIDAKLEIRYLEHIINELNEGDASFHQKLVDLYLMELKKGDIEDDVRDGFKCKLEAFMLKSKAYNKARTLPQLPANDPTFYEARAIVYSALNQHKSALSVYVFQIKDYEKAENYCNKAYIEEQAEHQACLLDGTTTHEKPYRPFEPEDSSTKPNIFAILLGLYLRPPPGEEKRWPQALELLSKHGARLPASSTLDLMPDDLAVKELQSYFRGRIRNATSILREEQIVRSLEGVRRTNTERLLALGPDSLSSEKPLGKNRRVRIGEDDHCKVCHKRFGASAVRVYPDNQVIHYGCIGRSNAPRRSAGWG